MGRIVLEQVSKSFGDTEVIPPLDLTIEDGEFAVFVGPSGCGKSTLLRLIAGLEDTSGGRIVIDGEDATMVPPAKRGLSMVFQSYALYPHMTVRKNIAFPMRMAGMDKAEQDRRIEKAAAALNLTDYLHRRPGQLSGGQRQRVAIGRAIVREPAAFLFDEPLSNLDAALRVGMRLEISELQDGGPWSGVVGVSEHLGSDTFLHIHDTGLGDMITVRTGGEVNFRHGDRVSLTPRMDVLHRFDANGLRIE